MKLSGLFSILRTRLFGRKIDNYEFSDKVVAVIKPISSAIDQHYISSAEKMLAELTLQVCQQVEKGLLNPKEVDDYFTLLDLYLGDNHPEAQLCKEVRTIIQQGNLFHDFGTEYGPHMASLRNAAKAVLNMPPSNNDKPGKSQEMRE